MSKYAARAMADSIYHELRVKGVSMHMYMPGTIDTPGLVEENKTKPLVA